MRNELESLISKGELKNVIELLIDIQDPMSKNHHSTILLSERLSKLEKDFQKGILKYEDFLTFKSQISANLLKIIKHEKEVLLTTEDKLNHENIHANKILVWLKRNIYDVQYNLTISEDKSQSSHVKYWVSMKYTNDNINVRTYEESIEIFKDMYSNRKQIVKEYKVKINDMFDVEKVTSIIGKTGKSIYSLKIKCADQTVESQSITTSNINFGRAKPQIEQEQLDYVIIPLKESLLNKCYIAFQDLIKISNPGYDPNLF